MFDFIPYRHLIFALSITAIPGLIISYLPTYQHYIGSIDDDSKNEMKEDERARLERHIDLAVGLMIITGILIGYIYILLSDFELQWFSIVATSIIRVVSIIGPVYMFLIIIATTYEFIKLIIGKATGGLNMFPREITVLYTSIFFSLVLMTLDYENLHFSIYESVYLMRSELLSDVIIIIVYFSFYSIFPLMVFLNVFISVRVIMEYTLLKKDVRSKERNKSKDWLFEVAILPKKLRDKTSNVLWIRVQSSRHIFKFLLRISYIALYVFLKITTRIIHVVFLIMMLCRRLVITPLISLKRLFEKIRDADFIAIVGISSRVTFVMAFVIVYFIFRYNEIISNDGLDAYEFFFTLLIIPAIFASIIKIRQKKDNGDR